MQWEKESCSENCRELSSGKSTRIRIEIEAKRRAKTEVKQKIESKIGNSEINNNNLCEGWKFSWWWKFDLFLFAGLRSAKTAPGLPNLSILYLNRVDRHIYIHRVRQKEWADKSRSEKTEYITSKSVVAKLFSHPLFESTANSDSHNNCWKRW